jgi:hypothetical protein
MALRTKESCSRRTPGVTLGINSRILAIELRYRRFGFAAMEVPRELLDTGVRTFRLPIEIAGALRPLIKLFTPSAIVIKIANQNDRRYRCGMAATIKCIRREAAARSIPVDRVASDWVRNVLDANARNKEHIARLVIQTFPSLSWKLPPTRERKPWVSEGWNMAIFDAVAIGLAYIGESPVHVPTF